MNEWINEWVNEWQRYGERGERVKADSPVVLPPTCPCFLPSVSYSLTAQNSVNKTTQNKHSGAIRIKNVLYLELGKLCSTNPHVCITGAVVGPPKYFCHVFQYIYYSQKVSAVACSITGCHPQLGHDFRDPVSHKPSLSLGKVISGLEKIEKPTLALETLLVLA